MTSSTSGGEWPFDALVCDGAFYAEQLVAESLHVPVYAIGLTMVMPDCRARHRSSGLRPARTPVGRLHHAVVRRLLASAMKAGTTHYNEILARHGIAPIRPRRLPPRADAEDPAGLPQRLSRAWSSRATSPFATPSTSARWLPARPATGPDTPLPDCRGRAHEEGRGGVPGHRRQRRPRQADRPHDRGAQGVRRMSSSPRPRAHRTRQLRARFPEPNVSSKTSSTMTTCSPTSRRSSPAVASAATWPHSCTASLSWGPESARARTTSTPGSATTSSASTCGRAPEASGDPQGGPERPQRPHVRREGRRPASGTPRLRPDGHDRERAAAICTVPPVVGPTVQT